MCCTTQTNGQISKDKNFKLATFSILKLLSMYSKTLPLLLIGIILSCQPKANNNTTAFVGATIIDGTGQLPINDGVIIVSEGKIIDIGSKSQVTVPKNIKQVDVTGKFIMPGLINAHGHIGGTEGLQGGKYSAENVLRDLQLNARYGITSVISLGGDGEPSLKFRNEQDNAQLNRSRLFLAGIIVTGETPDDVREVVRENAANKVDFIKIRVDDNLGTTEKMMPEVYSAVIEEAHLHNIPVASHLFYLEDAKGLLQAGTDFIAHSVRDQLVDQEFIDLIKAKDVYYCPTIMREVSTFIYEEIPAFFSDPFFIKEADQSVIEALSSPERQEGIRNSRSAQAYKVALDIANQNLKILSDAGVKVVMGTDAGPPARFQGYFEHKEMEMMVAAGLTPHQVLMSATSNAANYLGLENLGALKPGYWADFLILKANPLEDINNSKSIAQVYIAGNQVN